MEVSQDAEAALGRLLEEYHTASLATVNEDGSPQVSYTPVALDSRGGSFYLFVSELSAHTANLKRSGAASVMLMEDEKGSEQLFARHRVTFQGTVEAVERDSEGWDLACQTYGQRFGKLFDLLVGLKDFHMFRFVPSQIRLVVGFGAAYDVRGADWSELELLTGK